jgi:hypothetical protein
MCHRNDHAIVEESFTDVVAVIGAVILAAREIVSAVQRSARISTFYRSSCNRRDLRWNTCSGDFRLRSCWAHCLSSTLVSRRRGRYRYLGAFPGVLFQWPQVPVAKLVGIRLICADYQWMITLLTTAGRDRYPSIEVLLDLDGQLFVVDTEGRYWVRFSVNRVASTPERPHGLKYSLTLHGPDGGRADRI